MISILTWKPMFFKTVLLCSNYTSYVVASILQFKDQVVSKDVMCKGCTTCDYKQQNGKFLVKNIIASA